MAFFTKSDPAVKLQRDLDNKLQAKRTSRDDLLKRRQAAEASAAAYREKAVKLASDGGDDTTLSAAETAMRREQDRISTLSDAITKSRPPLPVLSARSSKSLMSVAVPKPLRP